MKNILISLLTGLILFPGLGLNAQMSDDEDDNYLGFQLSIPLGGRAKTTGFANAEYSVMLVNRNSGITDGVVWTYDDAGEHTLGYLRPSSTFSIGKSKLVDYRVPLVSSEDNGGIGISNLDNGVEFLFYTVAGIYLIGKAFEDAFTDVFDSDDDESDESDEADAVE